MNYEEITREDIVNYRGYRKDIKGDKFSLYISNYPANAQYLRSRIGNPEQVLAELCCSIGVTLEYLALGFKKVIGVDLDKDILEECRTNLEESGLTAQAELIRGDVFDDNVLRNIKADTVVYDIPFWYPHKQENQGSLIDKNPPLEELISKIRKYITYDIIIFSPPEWSYEYFSKKLGVIEYEQVFIDGQHNRNQIYLGDLVKAEGLTKVEIDSSLPRAGSKH
ncbi:MAG: class I SAM-dependent methyltransferase [Bacteroidota bacterium]